jgi:hypothetical protein
MQNIKFTKSELFKNYLYLKFDGICGVGTSGNIDADYIIRISKEKIAEITNVQALIFDFSELEYKFGNRFLNLFHPNVFKNNIMIPISIISNNESLENWKSLFEYGYLNLDFYGNPESVFQDNVKNSINSINKRFNKKNNA